MKTIFKNQSGAVLITYAILLMVLLGFTALGVEVGRWYLVRSELSKAVDAAALAGAKNISNPNIPRESLDTLAREVGNENFPAGQLGTPAEGLGGSVSFTTTLDLEKRNFRVDGWVNTLAFLARLFGITQVPTSSSGVAHLKQVEIMLVLDRSVSMWGTKIDGLREAALSFVSFFRDTENDDKMGLITYATGVTRKVPLSNYFVSEMETRIRELTSSYIEGRRDKGDGSGRKIIALKKYRLVTERCSHSAAAGLWYRDDFASIRISVRG